MADRVQINRTSDGQLWICRLNDGYSIVQLLQKLDSFHQSKQKTTLPFVYVFPSRTAFTEPWSLRATRQFMSLRPTQCPTVALVNAPRNLKLLMHMAREVYPDLWTVKEAFIFADTFATVSKQLSARA